MSEAQTAAGAGWYADPSGAHQLRYWDGFRWTEHVANNGVQSVAPIHAVGKLRRGQKEVEREAARRAREMEKAERDAARAQAKEEREQRRAAKSQEAALARTAKREYAVALRNQATSSPVLKFGTGVIRGGLLYLDDNFIAIDNATAEATIGSGSKVNHHTHGGRHPHCWPHWLRSGRSSSQGHH